MIVHEMASGVAAGISFQGTRERNEDALLIEIIGDSLLIAVADGVGGRMGGEIASSIAVRSLFETIRDGLGQNAEGDPGALLAAGFQVADTQVGVKALGDLSGMATTLVATLIRGRNAVFAHTGDSRAYILGLEGIRFRTRDHSVVESLIERGEIQPCDAPTHPFRNILTRCIGASFKVDISSHQIEESDVVLLCTDGFYGVVGEEGMVSCIGRGFATEMVDCLSGKARDGATDNVTLAAWTPIP